MAKRFTDTNLYSKKWFRKLPPRVKCLWELLRSQCDHAGVVEIDLEMASFQIGEEITENDLKLLENQIKIISDDKIWLTGFVDFQYGELKENYNPHKPVINSLKKHNLFLTLEQPLNKTSLSLMDKGMDKDKDKDKDKDSFGKSENLLQLNDPIVEEFANYFSQTSQIQKERVCSFINKGGENFINQTRAYIEYKSISGERSHSWISYQREWVESDWIHKLDQEKKRQDNAKGIVVSVSKVKHNLSEAEKAKKKAGLIE